MSGGRLFQIRAVLGKNKYLWEFTLDNGNEYLFLFEGLTQSLAGKLKLTSLCLILKNIVRNLPVLFECR